MVNDLDNSGELSLGRSVVDEDDSSDLDESLEGGCFCGGLHGSSGGVKGLRYPRSGGC